MLSALIFAAFSGFYYLPWTISDAQNQISIHGNNVTSAEQVRATLASAIGKPLYQLDPKQLQRLVCTLPTVRYAFVRRHALPKPGLDVEILEEFPWASFCSDPDSKPEAVISESGRMIPISDFPTITQPQLKLCGPADFKFTPAQVAHWDMVVRLLSAQIGQPVSVVDLRQPMKIVAYCGDLELHIGQDDSALLQRLKRLNSVLPAALALKDKLKFVDLSLDSNIPLKVDRSEMSTTSQGELLHQAVKALASNE